MKNKNPTSIFTISSQIVFKFQDENDCEICYNSFLPELSKIHTSRSNIEMIKHLNSLNLTIKSNDITAFRASLNDVISLGKIMERILDTFNFD